MRQSNIINRYARNARFTRISESRNVLHLYITSPKCANGSQSENKINRHLRILPTKKKILRGDKMPQLYHRLSFSIHRFSVARAIPICYPRPITFWKFSKWRGELRFLDACSSGSTNASTDGCRTSSRNQCKTSKLGKLHQCMRIGWKRATLNEGGGAFTHPI